MPAPVTPVHQKTILRKEICPSRVEHLFWVFFSHIGYTGTFGKKNANPTILLAFYWQGGRLALRPDIT